MAKYQFQIPTLDEARRTLGDRAKAIREGGGMELQSLNARDVFVCVRVVTPDYFTSPGERAAAQQAPTREQLVARCAERLHRCTACGQFWFAKPRLCFWCERGIIPP